MSRIRVGPALLAAATLLACGCKKAQQILPETQMKGPEQSADLDDARERLLRAMESIREGDAIYLDGLGWFRILRYAAYEGRNPRTGVPVAVPAKTTVLYEPDGNLLNLLNGMPHEDLGDPTQSNRNNIIHRYDWAKPLADHLSQELVARETVDIAELGTLSVEPREVVYRDVDPPRRVTEKRVFWRMSEAAHRRLDPKR